MYLEAALLALFLGLILGGSLKKLLDLKMRWLSLLIVSVFMSLLPKVPVLGVYLAGLGTPAAVTVAVFRYGFLLAFAALNYRYISVCIIGAGGLSNFIVTMANGGRMPVSAKALGVKPGDAGVALLKGSQILNYRVAGAGTRLSTMSDVIQARGINIYFLSVGDILISIGIFALILQLMEPKLLKGAIDRIRRLPVFHRR
jgi:hypothetical protein